MKNSISLEEYDRRIARMRQHMAEHGLDGLCIFGANRTFYLSGFHHVATERPVVLVVPLEGEIALLVPHLEEENIPVRNPNIKEMKVYREYPGLKHPMLYLAELLQDKGLADKHLGVDSEGWGGGWGYRGPSLPEVAPEAKLTNIRDVIDDIRMVKSEEELELIRVSAHFGNVAHGLLQEYVEVGVAEIDIANRAATDATSYMVKAMPADWEPNRSAGARVSFTSGPKTSFNHRQAGGRKIQPGDVLLTLASAEVGGYVSELERMMIVGPPTDEHKKYFELEVQAQDAAFSAIRAGARCCDIEKAVNAFLEKEGLHELTRTHIGHGIGTEGHEAPFFDLGDETVLQAGMVMTVEPCLFLPGFAGFRHSDTVLVTEDGFEMITYYPRDLESLTIPI
ncbi:Xaa-Pro peptidase family protein [Chloroflexi bacterium TSY]|nr:Xaa-Pro peptidase family protein [Chloroflexi bacterium TSY]